MACLMSFCEARETGSIILPFKAGLVFALPALPSREPRKMLLAYSLGLGMLEAGQLHPSSGFLELLLLPWSSWAEFKQVGLPCVTGEERWCLGVCDFLPPLQ